jgi:hypothetical protein
MLEETPLYMQLPAINISIITLSNLKSMCSRLVNQICKVEA